MVLEFSRLSQYIVLKFQDIFQLRKFLGLNVLRVNSCSVLLSICKYLRLRVCKYLKSFYCRVSFMENGITFEGLGLFLMITILTELEERFCFCFCFVFNYKKTYSNIKSMLF